MAPMKLRLWLDYWFQQVVTGIRISSVGLTVIERTKMLAFGHANVRECFCGECSPLWLLYIWLPNLMKPLPLSFPTVPAVPRLDSHHQLICLPWLTWLPLTLWLILWVCWILNTNMSKIFRRHWLPSSANWKLNFLLVLCRRHFIFCHFWLYSGLVVLRRYATLIIFVCMYVCIMLYVPGAAK